MTTEVPLTAVLTSSPDTAGSLSASAVTASKGFAAHMAASPGGDLLNAVQYAALAYIPCALLMYGLAEAKAGADLSASSPMLTFEVLAMTAATVAGLYYIDRLVTYIPTYSGVPYAGISIANRGPRPGRPSEPHRRAAARTRRRADQAPRGARRIRRGGVTPGWPSAAAAAAAAAATTGDRAAARSRHPELRRRHCDTVACAAAAAAAVAAAAAAVAATAAAGRAATAAAGHTRLRLDVRHRALPDWCRPGRRQLRLSDLGRADSKRPQARRARQRPQHARHLSIALL